jgi:hypothetical protein
MNQKIGYIFSINTGRSGSDYLARAFTHVHGCRSFHEPKPIGNENAMRQFLRGHDKPIRQLTEKKLEEIRNNKGGGEVYVETNHCFIKGFGWFITQHIPEEQIGVIILKREKSKIADSLLSIGCSPLVRRGMNWVITPSIDRPLVAPPRRLISYKGTYYLARFIKIAFFNPLRKFVSNNIRDPEWLTAYELECLAWYVDETHSRARVFQELHPRITYYEVCIEDLNSLENFNAMLNHFDLKAKESLGAVIGNPTNVRIPKSNERGGVGNGIFGRSSS